MKETTFQKHLVLVADFRSPHARSWIAACESLFTRVTCVNSFPESAHGSLLGSSIRHLTPHLRGIFSDTVPTMNWLHAAGVQLRHQFRYRQAQGLARRIERAGGDHVHALRMPWEGVAAELSGQPFSVSLWGHDLVQQAPQSSLLTHTTRRALRHCAGLTADCHRDVQLAHDWGLPTGTLTAVIPGDVSIQMASNAVRRENGETMRLCCPRGILPHVRWRELVAAVRALNAEGRSVELNVLDVPSSKVPGTYPRVKFLPRLTTSELHALARQTDVVISPTTSDGIPNSVLEFMAAGAVPVLGDIASSREVVEESVNGLLCDPVSPRSIKGALERLLDPDLRLVLSAAAVETVRRDYSAPVAQKRLQTFFDRLLGMSP